MGHPPKPMGFNRKLVDECGWFNYLGYGHHFRTAPYQEPNGFTVSPEDFPRWWSLCRPWEIRPRHQERMAEARAISGSASTREPLQPWSLAMENIYENRCFLVLFFHHQPGNFKHLQEGFAENWVLPITWFQAPHHPISKAKIIPKWCHSCIQLHLSIAWLVHVGSIFNFHFEGRYPKLLKTCIWLYPEYVTQQQFIVISYMPLHSYHYYIPLHSSLFHYLFVW